MANPSFDEQAQEALRILFNQFWILRSKEPALYQQIREREKILKNYIDEKFGYTLIFHQHFIKLEKTPVEPMSWMGITDFQEQRDYAIFCCALAFTDSRTVEEQFLLSDICEEIKELYPGDISLDWTNYNHRRSLVRVIKFMENMHLLHIVEGEIEQFTMDEEQEVLYETTVYAQYFMRSYPKDLFEYETKEDILQSEWEIQDSDGRRKRVYRQLMISPAIYRKNEEDLDFAYIRNYRNRLRDDFEAHALLRLEVFKNNALLVSEERKQTLTLFPDQKAIMDVVLHLATYIRENEETFPKDEFDQIYMTYQHLEQTVQIVHEQYGKGWSKQYREGSIQGTTREAIQLLKDWEMITELDGGTYVIRPLLGRVAAYYPKDFLENGGDNDG